MNTIYLIAGDPFIYLNGAKINFIQYPAGELELRLPLLDGDPCQVRVTYKPQPFGGFVMLNQLATISSALATQLNPFEITYHIPYLPYSRNDRRFAEYGSDGLKLFLDQLKVATRNSVIYTLDVHNEQALLPYNVNSITPGVYISQAIDGICYFRGGVPSGLNIVFPDAGAKLRYEELIKNLKHITPGLKLEFWAATKTRNPSTGVVETTSFPQISNPNPVLIVDDICDGGATFINLAKALGFCAADTYLYVTHGIFSRGVDELNTYFDKVFTTRSIETQAFLGVDKFTITPDTFPTSTPALRKWAGQ